MPNEPQEYSINEYALIGNCETAALINPGGGIDWLCLPDFDSSSFFGALLDRTLGGEFYIRPAHRYVVEREYIEDSAILRTRFTTEKGIIELTDFFVIAREPGSRFYDFTSLHPTRKLVRTLKVVSGDSYPIELFLKARADYGREEVNWNSISEGFQEQATGGAKLFSNFPIKIEDGDLTSNFLARPKNTYFAVLDYGDQDEPPTSKEINRWLAITKAYWHEWNLFNYYRGDYERIVRRSAVTLKLLTYSPTGAFVAAPTTSLPEKIGGEQNWDYRYTWVRDTSLFINAMFRLGYSGEAKAFVNFILRHCTEEAREKGSDSSGRPPVLKVLYPIKTDSSTEERTLEQLSGYRQSTPVRVGNRAVGQFQLDNYGHLMEALYYFRHTGGKINSEISELLNGCLQDIDRFWQEPDNGIWETPQQKLYTYGKIMACLALEQAAELGCPQPESLREKADRIRQDVLRRGLASGDGDAFLANIYYGEDVDAACLLAFTSGFLSKKLACSTRAKIEEDLVSGPFVYRNLKQREQLEEGAFILCSFWWINHLIREGDLVRAEQILDQILDKASPLGLFAEEIDPGSGEFLGNFPQAFSHLGLIATVLNLEQSKKDPGFHSLSEAEKFKRSVGTTIGLKGVLSGFIRVPRTFKLLFSNRSKWK